jgi:hypothetical protein
MCGIPFGVVLAGAALVVADAPTSTKPTSPKSDPSRLSPEAARMYACVTKPHPGELKWQQIPWLTDLALGVRQARSENRPLLLFVSGDEPLEKC